MRWGGLLVVLLLAATLAGACASSAPPPPVVTAPRFPSYPEPSIPADLPVTPALAGGHRLAWRRLQSGDLRGAARDFSALLKATPEFYPAETGLGFVHLAGREFSQAAERFAAVLARDDRYLPAWLGQAEAQLGLTNDGQAIVALERVLVLDPNHEGVQTRLELVRFRQVQSLIDEGRRERQAGRLDEAERAFEEALRLSPSSSMILRELARVELQAGKADEAQGHLGRAVALEPTDAEGHAALGQLLEARGRYREAAAAYARAVAIDPRPEWRKVVTALGEKADLAALPAVFGDLASASSITRAHVAAYVGTRLARLIAAAPQRPTAVATDVRGHWAAPWILPVTRAGVMTVYPNHTFQPGGTVRRGDLAQVASELVALASAARPSELAGWRAARPQFADLPSANVFYRSAALAVAAGVMNVETDGRFRATAPATGAELVSVVGRIGQLTAR